MVMPLANGISIRTNFVSKPPKQTNKQKKKGQSIVVHLRLHFAFFFPIPFSFSFFLFFFFKFLLVHCIVFVWTLDYSFDEAKYYLWRTMVAGSGGVLCKFKDLERVSCSLWTASEDRSKHLARLFRVPPGSVFSRALSLGTGFSPSLRSPRLPSHSFLWFEGEFFRLCLARLENN